MLYHDFYSFVQITGIVSYADIVFFRLMSQCDSLRYYLAAMDPTRCKIHSRNLPCKSQVYCHHLILILMQCAEMIPHKTLFTPMDFETFKTGCSLKLKAFTRGLANIHLDLCPFSLQRCNNVMISYSQWLCMYVPVWRFRSHANEYNHALWLN